MAPGLFGSLGGVANAGFWANLGPTLGTAAILGAGFGGLQAALGGGSILEGMAVGALTSAAVAAAVYGGIELYHRINQSPVVAGEAQNRERVDGVQALRKDINLSGEDKYGHWWIEIDGDESYGWWPKEPVGAKGTLFGVEGELNGQTSFRGTPTWDPHVGDRGSGVNVFDVYARSGTSGAAVREGIRSFANSYRGSWSWPWGQNCHSFQNQLLQKLDLQIRPAGP